jgi:hypothetical protein
LSESSGPAFICAEANATSMVRPPLIPLRDEDQAAVERRYFAPTTGVTSGFAPGGGLWQSLQSCFFHASPMSTG